jgi:hypothetical protein
MYELGGIDDVNHTSENIRNTLNTKYVTHPNKE